jgi:hypothetical protein
LFDIVGLYFIFFLQITAYSGGAVAGSFFWNFRIEEPDPMWDFLYGLQQGYMPQTAAQWALPGCN